ncbi:MAG: PspA/IM30 family protein [Acidobacteria bacterium]|nr:PspA/IM30 family protein [Acidobacteriota bacterium]
MALLERVTTLVRANLNDLIDKAEDPEKMIKQVILDMENQLLQVKTQVAIAIADQHLLEKRETENEARHGEWVHRAEMAVDRKDDALARAALERAMSYEQMRESYRQQIADQRIEVENLKSALHKLQQKLAEARAKADLLLSQHRRSRAMSRAADAHAAAGDGNGSRTATFERMQHRIHKQEAASHARSELLADNIDERFASLEREEHIERLLNELKESRSSKP